MCVHAQKRILHVMSSAARGSAYWQSLPLVMPQLPPMFPTDSRAMRSFSKQAYTSGVVIIKCPDCGSRHLIADRLGWFGDSASVETILKEKGQGMRLLILAAAHSSLPALLVLLCNGLLHFDCRCLLRRCAVA